MATTIRAIRPYVSICGMCDLFFNAGQTPIQPCDILFQACLYPLLWKRCRLSLERVSLVSSLVTSSLTIKRILSRSASVNSPSAGSAIAEKSIKRASIVFMGCSSSSLIYPPAKVGGWQTCLAASFAVPPKTGHSYYTTFWGKKASRFLIQREPYRERHDLKTYVQLKIPATTTRTVAIQSII